MGEQNPLAIRLEAAASALDTDAGLGRSASDPSLLRYLGYDDGSAAKAHGRARMLRAEIGRAHV